MDHQDWKIVDVGNPALKKLRSSSNQPKEIQSKNLKNNSSSLQGTGKKFKEDEEGFTSLKKDDFVGGTIGKQISQFRCAKKISQKDLANKLNVLPSVVQSYENGKALKNNSMLAKIEKVLGCKLNR